MGTLGDHYAVIKALEPLIPQIRVVGDRMAESIEQGGKILWMGNGGSAADSQHMAAEIVGRFTRERKGLPSIALTTDSSILTAVANDYGYEAVFRRQVEALCNPGDVVVGISTSGNSKNVVAALQLAKETGAFTVGLTGPGGMIKEIVDVCLGVPSLVTARIQEAHELIGHILCDIVESHMEERQHGQ
jgi:D-sedoheptulose 7-phosphate isomerase